MNKSGLVSLANVWKGTGRPPLVESGRRKDRSMEEKEILFFFFLYRSMEEILFFFFLF
jgi:hypothetical protein